MYWVLTFIACFSLDFVWTRLIVAVHHNRRFAASLYSGLFTLLNYAATAFFVDDRWMIIPACLGAILGISLAIGYDEETRET
jgi:hypothetical protein